jgi:hypothetical protein
MDSHIYALLVLPDPARIKRGTQTNSAKSGKYPKKLVLEPNSPSPSLNDPFKKAVNATTIVVGTNISDAKIIFASDLGVLAEAVILGSISKIIMIGGPWGEGS